MLKSDSVSLLDFNERLVGVVGKRNMSVYTRSIWVLRHKMGIKTVGDARKVSEEQLRSARANTNGHGSYMYLQEALWSVQVFPELRGCS